MPKLRKEDTDDLDVDELESAEYTEGQNFTSYDGEVPPVDTILRAYVKAMWWTRTSNDDPMLKVLTEAAENEGDLEEYNGLPMWENMALTTGAKFKWHPFLTHFGLTIRDVKSKTVVAKEDDSMGAPIEKIAAFIPGSDSDEAWCRVVTAREKYNGQWQAHVASWLEYESDDDESDADDEPEDEEAEEEAEDEEAEAEAEDEEEEAEAAPPARGRRSAAKPAAKPAAARTARTAGKAPAATGTRSTARRSATAASGAAKGKPATTPAARSRGRRAAAGSSDDPPF